MDKVYFMRQALKQAVKAMEKDEVPIGAVVVKDGKIIARAYNQKEKKADPTAHAEMIAIVKATKKLESRYLNDADLYVTLEPCAMCAGAMVNARLGKLYFGAWDKRFGCAGTLCNIPGDGRFNHTVEVEGGVLADECAALLGEFFQKKRKSKNNRDTGEERI